MALNARARDGYIALIDGAPMLFDCIEFNEEFRYGDAASEIGAAAVVVHGGHLTGEGQLSDTYPRWRKALQELDTNVPVLIENTAGGDNAVVRRVESIAALWSEIGDLGPGFVLDTCHAWAGGEPGDELVGRILAATGSCRRFRRSPTTPPPTPSLKQAPWATVSPSAAARAAVVAASCTPPRYELRSRPSIAWSLGLCKMFRHFDVVFDLSNRGGSCDPSGAQDLGVVRAITGVATHGLAQFACPVEADDGLAKRIEHPATLAACRSAASNADSSYVAGHILRVMGGKTSAG